MAAPEESPTRPGRARRPPAEPSAIVLVISGPIDRADLTGLCERVGALLESSNADLVVCEMGELVDADAVTVDALARLQLTARRLGRRLRLSRACGELQELLALMGLADAVPIVPGSWSPFAAIYAGLPVEPGGEVEEREQARGIEEEARPDDPAT